MCLDPAQSKKSTLLNNLFYSKLCVTVFKNKNAIQKNYIVCTCDVKNETPFSNVNGCFNVINS